jgi:glyoxylase-like metal-dependent hydrolase (beta-lactamase superfamily II)
VDILEVAPGIHWIEGINGNCYLLVDKEITLIDTGLPHKAKKILRYISDELHRAPSDLKMIVLTHCHVDHIGNARELRNLTGAKIAAHKDDAVYISGKR